MNITSDIQNKIERMAPWFHNLHLPDGSQTAPDHFFGDFPNFKWQQIKAHIPEDLTGWSVLDIGCNAGFYSFELAGRGAQVTAIDLDTHYLRQAEWAAGQYELEENIRFKQMQVYDLAHTDEKYDLVWFMGVLYHLRYPLLALDIVTRKVGKLLMIQTLTMPGQERYEVPNDISIDNRDQLAQPGWPKASFIEHRLAGDPTNWWTFDHACIEAMLRSCGMKIIVYPSEETYIAEPDPENPPPVTTWNRSEFLSAIGKGWKKEAIHKTQKNNL